MSTEKSKRKRRTTSSSAKERSSGLALQDKYFLFGLDAAGRHGSPGQKRRRQVGVIQRANAATSTGGAIEPLQLYAGPKEYDTLRSLNVGLEDTIDFGWFIFGSWSVVKAVAKPIFYVLRFINELYA